MEGQQVLIAFKGGDPDVRQYVVERSPNGVDFSAVGAPILPIGGQTRFEFRDAETPGRVVYYRVREQLAQGADRTSQTVKVGAGAGPVWSAHLDGNFPNPFNPQTTVRFTLDESQPVTVSVWDLSGQEVLRLSDGVLPAGAHEVSFDGGELPSGSYFVRLRTPQGVQSHQMLLMK
jgi:hypothetical protein